MKIGMIVGACGLALAGTAVAGGFEERSNNDLQPQSVKPFVTQTDRPHMLGDGVNMASGLSRSLANGSARGSLVLDDTFNLMDADQMRPQEDPGFYIRAQSLITGPTADNSLTGQRNVDDGSIPVLPWVCIVNNAVAISDMDGIQANGEYSGPAGGPDPAGVRDGMLAYPRASTGQAPIGTSLIQTQINYNTNFYTGTNSMMPHVFQIDLYRTDPNAPLVVTLFSNTEGSTFQSFLTGEFPFDIANVSGAPGVVGGMSCLMEGSDPSTAFRSVNEYTLNEGWMTLLCLTIPGSNLQAVFVRDDETSAPLARGGGSVYQMPDKIGGMPGEKMFDEFGLGLEDGWVQIMPGTEDDMSTPDIIEGAGFAVDASLTDDDLFIEINNGNRYGGIGGFTFGMDFFAYGTGDFDMIVEDEWMDNMQIRGIPFPAPDPIPAYRVPYVDDIELWTPGLMALQGGRFTAFSTSGLLVSEDFNNTTDNPASDGGAPAQSLALPNLLQDGFYRQEFNTNLPTDPAVISEVGDPVVAEVSFRVADNQIGYTFAGADGIYAVSDVEEDAGFVLTSATDANLLGDGQVYVRQRKPEGSMITMGEYDDTEPTVPLSGPDLTPDQINDINTEFTNVPAAPASARGGFSFPLNSFARIRLEVEPGTGPAADNGDPNILRVFVDGTELFPDGDDTMNFTTAARSMNELEFGSSNLQFKGSDVFLYVDDIFFDGPTQPDGTVELDPTVYGDDPAWELPFADGLDTYDTAVTPAGQGFSNYRADFLPVQDPDVSPVPTDFSEIEFVDGASPLTNGDDVILYEVVEILSGETEVDFAETEIVAVSNDIFSEINPADNQYGRAPENDMMGMPTNDPTEWYVVDSVGGNIIARGTWYLANATGEGTFDTMSGHVDSGIRFSYRQTARWGGAANEVEFVSAASEGIDTARGSRGDVAKMTVTSNPNSLDPNGSTRNNETVQFSSLLPPAETAGTGSVASLSLDVYIGQSDFQTGLSITFDGIGAAELDGDITGIGFGGLGFRSGDVDPMTEIFPTVPQGVFSYEIKNPSVLPDAEDTIWVDTGIAVPTEQWMTVEITLDENKDWTLSVDGNEIGSGKAIEFDMPALNTTGLDSFSATRNGYGDNDGNETSGDVIWTPLAPDAPAPISGEAGEAYHVFQLGGGGSADVLIEEAAGSLPDIWPVDAVTGDREMDMMMGMPIVRDIQLNDYVALVNNNPDTGMPFDNIITNRRFRIVDDMMNPLGFGEWTATNTPDQFGQSFGGDGAPGGITMGNVPGSGGGYNDEVPFRDIVLGNYVDVEATAVLPRDVWYIDNIQLSLSEGCPADLDGLGSVGSGDLGILLAAWGQSGGPADLDGSGTVGSGDLGVLLAAWGPCP